MDRRRQQAVWLVAATTCALGLAGLAAQARGKPSPAVAPPPGTIAVRAVLDQYCVSCHSTALHAGGLALDAIDADHPAYFHNAFLGATPIWLAARFSAPAIMRALAEHGADPRFVLNVEYPSGSYGSYGRTVEGPTSVLMAALGLGGGRGIRGWATPARAEREALTIEAATIAVSLGADLDIANAAGDTALHQAADDGLDGVVALLVEHGANAEIKNNKGKTALENTWTPQEGKPARRPRRER